MAQSNLVNQYCYITNTSKLKILSDLTKDRSMASIAGKYNTSVNTVQRVLASCSHQFIDGYDYLLEGVAFDEFKGVDRKLHSTCLNDETHEVAQILRNRFKKNLLKYVGKFTLNAKANVKTITMYLNSCYQGIRASFSNAQIIIDRFHMVQMLTRSLNSLRVAMMKKFYKGTREYSLLKSPRELYLKKFDDLERFTQLPTTTAITKIYLLKNKS